MLVSPIKFAGTTGTSFQDKIRQPQTFVRSEAPIASTGINDDEEEKSNIGKKAAIALGTVALVAAGLGAGKKYNVFAPGENTRLNTVKEYLDKAGEHVLNAVGWASKKFSDAKNSVNNFFKSSDEVGANGGNANPQPVNGNSTNPQPAN